jgi:hypothetical protein
VPPPSASSASPSASTSASRSASPSATLSPPRRAPGCVQHAVYGHVGLHRVHTRRVCARSPYPQLQGHRRAVSVGRAARSVVRGGLYRPLRANSVALLHVALQPLCVHGRACCLFARVLPHPGRHCDSAGATYSASGAASAYVGDWCDAGEPPPGHKPGHPLLPCLCRRAVQLGGRARVYRRARRAPTRPRRARPSAPPAAWAPTAPPLGQCTCRLQRPRARSERPPGGRIMHPGVRGPVWGSSTLAVLHCPWGHLGHRRIGAAGRRVAPSSTTPFRRAPPTRIPRDVPAPRAQRLRTCRTRADAVNYCVATLAPPRTRLRRWHLHSSCWGVRVHSVRRRAPIAGCWAPQLARRAPQASYGAVGRQAVRNVRTAPCCGHRRGGRHPAGPGWAGPPTSGVCFQVFPTATTWSGALAACAAAGGSRASLRSKAEADFVTGARPAPGRATWCGSASAAWGWPAPGAPPSQRSRSCGWAWASGANTSFVCSAVGAVLLPPAC